MKVTGIFGSPRKNGNTHLLTAELLRGAAEAGHEIVEYHINGGDLKGCQACLCCKQGRDCVVSDCLQPYWKDLHESGALVISAPIYMGRISGPMLTFADRHYCLMDGKRQIRLEPGKKLIGIFSQGSPNPAQYEAAIKEFLKGFQRYGMELAGTIIHTADKDLTPGSGLTAQAFALGRGLI